MLWGGKNNTQTRLQSTLPCHLSWATEGGTESRTPDLPGEPHICTEAGSHLEVTGTAPPAAEG